ncbi:hypothetical protein NF27_EY00770 [Candidatus Jidaibacter acanthamoeba]|uniref:Glutamine amidotransferase domain-containing protein n=1 Tax=Candidatus Jidaibacter acanthamoebae TaxID=86105 RepID=A0A0C1MYL1_9RICK|nr:gamma-glutamyl-gamma-aminobutyrate hydrolase family protein [Candidatus Jidaibacter acanthamoeba]KIE04981.1 hypothetical protein NF27_EY00770 [Candidatus Jidaibacter acanthamoeba]
MSKIFQRESIVDLPTDESLHRISIIRKLIGSLNVIKLDKDLLEFKNSFQRLDILLEHYNVQDLIEETINFEANFHDGSMERKYECIDYLVLKGANLNELKYIFDNLNIYEIQLLLDRGYSQNLAFKSILEILNQQDSQEEILYKAKLLIDHLIQDNKEIINELDYKSLPDNLPNEFIHFLIEKGLDLKVIFAKALFSNPENGLKIHGIQKKYFDIVFKHKPDIDNIFYDLSLFNLTNINIAAVKYLLSNGLSPDALTKTIINCLTIENYLSYDLGLQKDFVKELLELALNEGVETNYTKKNNSLINKFAGLGEYELLDLVLSGGTDNVLSISAYIESCYSITACMEIQKRFPDTYSEKEFYQYLRAEGKSNSETGLFLDKYNLTKDYLNYRNGFESNLSNIEIAIIESENIPVREVVEAKPINKYGFNLLHIALLNRDFALANKLIEMGVDLTEANNNEVSGILMLPRAYDSRGVDEKEVEKIYEIIMAQYKDIDIVLSNGENVIDHYLSNQTHKELIINKSKDPLFYFFKEDSDLFLPSQQTDKTHIAISHGEHFWSTGIYAFARLVMKKHSDVMFHLVTKEMLERGGDGFVNQFDGWINPGAGDSYPKHLNEFNISDWQPQYEIEETYQLALDKTSLYNIPYMGMCAGAQHFILYNKGYLSPLNDYNHGRHEVSYLKGTLAHFQAMTSLEQQQALLSCEFPEIKFMGDTAHHFAGVLNKLGNDIELGAISEDEIPMSYAHINGLSYATQFHPEHYYNMNNDEGIVNYQMVWLDNFINLSKMHHQAIYNNEIYPEIYMSQIKQRLEECNNKKTNITENEPHEQPFNIENTEILHLISW